MTRLHAAVFLAVVCGCKTTQPDTETLRNENRNLHGVVEQQEHRIDELTADRARLDRRVKELAADLDRVKSTETAVEEAKDEISEHVRQMLERFKGDSDIEIERTDTGYRFVLREAVLFNTGSADLTEEGRGTLARVAEALRGGNERLSIEGHTDDLPVAKPETLAKFPRGNMDLSVQRALAVWDFFSKEGSIEASRMSVAGFGPHAPRVPNTSETNRWRNRRVEVRVQER